jgi:hypothetical protein
VTKAFGYLLLGILIVGALISLALLTWVWIRSENDPKESKPASIVSSQAVWKEEAGLALVDGRLADVETKGLEVKSWGLESLWVAYPAQSGKVVSSISTTSSLAACA